MASTVLITFSSTNGGTAISEAIDHGDVNNGATASAQTIYLRHNGDNNITNCGIYIAAEIDSYDGSFTSAADLTELLEWGNEETSTGFGGFTVNMNATGSFPAGSWPTYSTKDISSGGNVVGSVCRTGTGDSASNAITLPTQSGATSNGVIQTGSAPNVRFQCRFVIPSAEDTAGVRHIRQVLTYTYTS